MQMAQAKMEKKNVRENEGNKYKLDIRWVVRIACLGKLQQSWKK